MNIGDFVRATINDESFLGEIIEVDETARFRIKPFDPNRQEIGCYIGELILIPPIDSKPATWEHIGKVRRNLENIIDRLRERADRHDKSKLEAPEKEYFDRFTPLLQHMAYGSEEYQACLRRMKPAIKHHNSVNSHHPEFYGPEGIRGMSILDLVEMLCDWKAASERSPGGDLKASIESGQKRFGYSDDLKSILLHSLWIFA